MKKLSAYIYVATVLSVMLLSLAHAADHTRTLTGRVFDRQDQPVQKAVIYLKNTKSLAVKTYISDPDGSYRFPALSPNVDYEVYAEHNRARSDTKTLSAFDNRKLVNITLRIK
jgi:Carboxypeptidase regulatory-like domain